MEAYWEVNFFLPELKITFLGISIEKGFGSICKLPIGPY